MTSLPDPGVPSSVYDEAYYRQACAGYAEWVASDGQAVSGIYPGFLEKAGLRPGEVVVDIGTGRGELLAVAVAKGADRAYGIEYSEDAVGMARQTIERHGAREKVEIILGDARSIPLPDGVADLVCFLDVVEHLTQQELHQALLQARRLLKPTGRVVAHTMPNRLIYDVTYRALRKWPAFRSWPADPRNEYEHLMHVNEQTLSSLRRAFEGAGLQAEVELGHWIYTEYLPSPRAKRVYHALARVRPLAQFGVGDLWAVGRRPGAHSS